MNGWIASWLLLAAPPELPPTAPPPSIASEALVAEATQSFVEGQHAFDVGRYLEAAAAFERSYAAIRSGHSLYNVALSYERAGKPVEAIKAARKYAGLPPCEPLHPEVIHCAARGDEVGATIERLTALVGQLWVRVEAGVTIRRIEIDGVVVPADDFPVVREPGPVEIEVVGVDAQERRRRVAELRAGQVVEVWVGPWSDRTEPPPPAVPVADPPAPTPVPPSPATQRVRPDVLRPLFWSGLGLTIASAAATAVLGGLTVAAKRQFDTGQCGEDCEWTEGDGGISIYTPYPEQPEVTFERRKLGFNVMFGVTAGLALSTAIVAGLTFSSRGRPDPARASVSVGRARIGVGLGALDVRW